MRGVTISDKDARGVLAFDLRDILKYLPNVADSEWEVGRLEYVAATPVEAFERTSDTEERIAGTDLIRLANEIDQLVEGEVRGYPRGGREPWVIVRAVDSTSFDVLATREDVLEALRRNFADVVDLPPQ